MEFGLNEQGRYVALKQIKHKGIIVPKGFEFDGVTVKAPLTFLFSNKNLRLGVRASCLHDWMCRNKHKYGRKYATDILIEVWQARGLKKFKSFFVRHLVNVYQYLKGWR
jgi:hypothetical protein